MWKTIQNETNYEVSSEGQVRNKQTKQIKSLRYSNKGYARVTLYPSGKTYSVHRLVAENFIINPNNYPSVNHKDGNKANNRLENLEWCTPKQNTGHAIDVIKTMSTADWSGIRNPEHKLDYGLVYSIKFGLLGQLSNFQLEKMLGVQEETVRRIKVNELWKHVVKVD